MMMLALEFILKMSWAWAPVMAMCIIGWYFDL